MKETPLLFSGPMVQAIAGRRKRMTRRVMKVQPAEGRPVGCGRAREYLGPKMAGKYGAYFDRMGHPMADFYPCPYGGPRDRLWVRESYFRLGHWEPVAGVVTRKTGRQKWRFVPDSREIRYAEIPPEAYRKGRHAETPDYSMWHQRLARFMPRAHSRFSLCITRVRAERLQEISAEDAIAEGIEIVRDEWSGQCGDFDETLSDTQLFEILWESIHGPGSWDLNPWVWVTEFVLLDGDPADEMN